MAAVAVLLGSRYLVRHENNIGNFSMSFFTNSVADNEAWSVGYMLSTLQTDAIKHIEKTVDYRITVE